MHPFFDYDSEARAHDLNLDDTNRYALPDNITAGIQHGSWSVPVPEPDAPRPGRAVVSSSRKEKRGELKYSKKDIEAIEEWVKRHVETTWHCLGVSFSFPPPPSPPSRGFSLCFRKTGLTIRACLAPARA
jgi:alcohol oxidase